MNISIYGVSELWLVIYVYVCICVYHLCAAQINSMDFRSAYNYNFFLRTPIFRSAIHSNEVDEKFRFMQIT